VVAGAPAVVVAGAPAVVVAGAPAVVVAGAPVVVVAAAPVVADDPASASSAFEQPIIVIPKTPARARIANFFINVNLLLERK
jgi:hypothetical protein